MKNIILSFLVAFATAGAYGSSGVGHGGDIVDRFLEATRRSLVDAVSLIRRKTDLEALCTCGVTDKPDLSCRTLQNLSDAQRDACRDFILKTADEYYSLNRPPHPTPFAVQGDPLFVVEQGVTRPVLAKTGPDGEIELYYEGIKDLIPGELLFLLGHEFGHLVSFPKPGAHLTDVDAYPPFETGRRMLDTVGSALAVYAAAHNLVGKYFGLDDKFSCLVQDLQSGRSFRSLGPSPRLFLGGNLDAYETGVGNLPKDFLCSVGENLDESSLWLTVKIHEEDGCKEIPSGKRWTLVELVRKFAPFSAVSPRPDEKLNSMLVPDWNPLCSGKVPSEALRMEYSPEKLAFEVKYEGSVGKNR